MRLKQADYNERVKDLTQQDAAEVQTGLDNMKAHGKETPETGEKVGSKKGKHIEEGEKELTEEEKEMRLSEAKYKKDVDELSEQDTMKLQMQLQKFNQQSELTTKTSEKSGSGVKTLFKNQ